jgi:MYXO-CTERM domain-containing protein
METVHGSCMCSMDAAATSASPLAPAFLFLLALALRRR